MFKSVRGEGTEVSLMSDKLSIKAKIAGIFYQDVMMDCLLPSNGIFFLNDVISLLQGGLQGMPLQSNPVTCLTLEVTLQSVLLVPL